jgi:hypothetical protein
LRRRTGGMLRLSAVIAAALRTGAAVHIDIAE